MQIIHIHSSRHTKLPSMDMKMCECYADDDLSPLDTQASTLPVLPELKLLYSLQIITCMRMGIRSVLTEVVHECRSN